MTNPKVTSLADQAKRFKAYRVHKKLNQIEMGELLNKSQATISKYELGLVYVPPDIVKKLHSALGMSLTWFYDGKGKIDDTPEKPNILKDVATLQATINQQEQRISALETIVRKLTRELYAEKHHV